MYRGVQSRLRSIACRRLRAFSANLVQPTGQYLNGLVGWWALDEASGNALDSHTNALTLTQGGTIASAAGVVGTSRLIVRASTQDFNRADEAAFGQVTACSYSVWFYPANVSLGASKFLAGQDGQLTIEHVDDYAQVTTTAGNNGYVAGCFALNTWAHYAVVYDGAQASNATRLKIYINGVQKTLSFSGTIPSPLTDVAASFSLGSKSHASGFLDGRLDEVAFWGRVLTSDEVTWLYNAGAGRSYAEAAAV